MIIGSHRKFLTDAWKFLETRKDWLQACEYLIACTTRHDVNVGGGHVRAEKYMGPCYHQTKPGSDNSLRPKEKLVSSYVKMMSYVSAIRDRYRRGVIQQRKDLAESSERCGDLNNDSLMMSAVN